MESTKKIKVSILIKFISDKTDKELSDHNTDGFLALSQIRGLLNAVSLKKDEEDSDTVLNLLKTARLSNEIMADKFLDIDREDLFWERMKIIDSINEVINLINTL
jgi:hypothetical protein